MKDARTALLALETVEDTTMFILNVYAPPPERRAQFYAAEVHCIPVQFSILTLADIAALISQEHSDYSISTTIYK